MRHIVLRSQNRAPALRHWLPREKANWFSALITAASLVPLFSKKTLPPQAKLAARSWLEKTLKELGFTKEIWPKYLGGEGKSVFPFNTLFHGQDISCSRRENAARPASHASPDSGPRHRPTQRSQMAAARRCGRWKGFSSASATRTKKEVAAVRETIRQPRLFELIATDGRRAVLWKRRG